MRTPSDGSGRARSYRVSFVADIREHGGDPLAHYQPPDTTPETCREIQLVEIVNAQLQTIWEMLQPAQGEA